MPRGGDALSKTLDSSTFTIMSNTSEILFDLILYVPSTICQLNRDGSSWVEPVLS